MDKSHPLLKRPAAACLIGSFPISVANIATLAACHDPQRFDAHPAVRHGNDASAISLPVGEKGSEAIL